MKKIIKSYWIVAVSAVALFAASCGHGGYNGQLLGVLDRPEWIMEIPYGMVYVHSGTLHVGPSDQDINAAMVQRPRSITVPGFFMDNTEITNNEYRQFTNWVRDSIAHKLMGDEYLIDPGGEHERIDWTKEIDWSTDDAKEKLADLMYDDQNSFWGQKAVDPGKLWYDFVYIDWKEAAKKENRDKPRSTFLKNNYIRIYPDTLCWIHDYTYAYNEPLTRNYYSHPAFDNYPVVGVNWKQATAFSIWRTRFMNDFNRQNARVDAEDFRLPFESEWEYAARGGHDNSPYPWGGPYLRNAKGCILANFKPMRGNYLEDGGVYTVKADAYFPNDFGLYNMSGNVSEWCADIYYENAYAFTHDLASAIKYDAKDGEGGDNPAMKRKVLRGGSWKDVGYKLQCGTREWEFQDTAKCYIGFRCIQSFLGRSLSDIQK
ncbi:MAG: gliding motility protein GldK [Bacteroidota bacterium]|jgi:gliding motility-associated lipoprotein GldK